jgi:hypothetical protein
MDMNVDIENLTPEYLAECVIKYERIKSAARERKRLVRAQNPEEERAKAREYMRRSGKALDYYYANRDQILAKRREQRELLKQGLIYPKN